MPILMMALLALVVFGLIGILLTVRGDPGAFQRTRHAAKGDAAHP